MGKRASNFIDLSGKKFNFLTAIKPIKFNKYIKWECICDCGSITLVFPAKLKSGHTKSCGCYQKKMMSDKQMVHGFGKTKLPNVRNAMVQRCTNKNTGMYYRYGGRGISVCEAWKDDPESFYLWATNNGYREGLTIDRIDNDGNYEPSNCRWITLAENISRNAKLSKSDKKDICEIYTNNDVTQDSISKKYGVHPTRIKQILDENNIKTKKRNQYGVWK